MHPSSSDSKNMPDLAALRKRLMFRAHHRGTQEADLIIGPFAAARLPYYAARELRAFEAILDLQDPDLYDWLIAGLPVPAEQDSEVMRELLAFRDRKIAL